MNQLLMAVFGLSSIAMAMGCNARARRWAPIVGLAGQPAWAYFAWSTAAWGLGILVLAYTGVYLWGICKQWGPKPRSDGAQDHFTAAERAVVRNGSNGATVGQHQRAADDFTSFHRAAVQEGVFKDVRHFDDEGRSVFVGDVDRGLFNQLAGHKDSPIGKKPILQAVKVGAASPFPDREDGE